jgi:hypothetical protein
MTERKKRTIVIEREAQRRGESLTQTVNRVLRDYLNHQAHEPQPAQPQPQRDVFELI